MAFATPTMGGSPGCCPSETPIPPAILVRSNIPQKDQHQLQVDYNDIFPNTTSTATTRNALTDGSSGGLAADDVDFWDYLLPRAVLDDDETTVLSGKDAKPTVTMYWADIGRDVSSAAAMGYLLGAERDVDVLLVADVANKTFVVDEAGEDSPAIYEWDEYDRFIIGQTPVDMELFEAVLVEAQKPER